MRESWELRRLEEVCSYDKTKHNGELLPYVGLENIESNSGRHLGGLEPRSVKSSTFRFTTSHILYGRLRPYLNKVLVPDFEGHCSTEIFPIIPNDKIIREYLFYWFIMDSTVDKIDSTWTGARMPRANMKEVIKFQIPIPPLPEQLQIVAILDEAFEAIDQAKANIEKNIENAKELFQSKLNDIFSQKGEGWEEKSLGEVTELYQGLAINKKTKHLLVENSSLPLIRIKDLKNNTEEQFVKEKGYPEQSKVGVEDIIYTRTGSLGLVFRGRRGILHNNSFKVVPTDELSKDYLFWWLQHDAFTKIIIGLASRAAQPDITHKLFKKQIISIPNKVKQAAYFTQIEGLNSDINKCVNAYVSKLNSLEELKKSILQKAFAGELTNKTVAV